MVHICCVCVRACVVFWDIHRKIERLTSFVCACVCARVYLSVCDLCVDLSIIHNTAGQFESLKGTLCCERAEKALPLPSSHLDSSSKHPSKSSHPRATGMGRNSSMTALVRPNQGIHLKKTYRGVDLIAEKEIHPTSLSRSEDLWGFGHVPELFFFFSNSSSMNFLFI